jgi:hypothetical protein
MALWIGASCFGLTLARWRRRGWRPLERKQHPLEAARAQLDDAVPLLTKDAMTTAGTFVQESATREQLEKLPDGVGRHVRLPWT